MLILTQGSYSDSDLYIKANPPPTNPQPPANPPPVNPPPVNPLPVNPPPKADEMLSTRDETLINQL